MFFSFNHIRRLIVCTNNGSTFRLFNQANIGNKKKKLIILALSIAGIKYINYRYVQMFSAFNFCFYHNGVCKIFVQTVQCLKYRIINKIYLFVNTNIPYGDISMMCTDSYLISSFIP